MFPRDLYVQSEKRISTRDPYDRIWQHQSSTAADCRNKPSLAQSCTVLFEATPSTLYLIIYIVIAIVIIVGRPVLHQWDIPWSPGFVPLITDCPPTASHCTLYILILHSVQCDNIQCTLYFILLHSAYGNSYYTVHQLPHNAQCALCRNMKQSAV